MANPEMQIEQINRLLDNSAPHREANAVQRFKGFVTATEHYEIHILRKAVDNFINSAWVPPHNASFPVFAPQLAFECKRLLAIEVDDKNRTAGAILQIEQREEIFHEDPPALRKMAVQEALARSVVVNPKIAGQTPEEIAAREAETKAYLDKHDGFFIDPSPEAMRKRLHI